VNPWPQKHELVKSDVHFIIKSSSVFALSIFVRQHFLTFTAAYLFSPLPYVEIAQSDWSLSERFKVAVKYISATVLRDALIVITVWYLTAKVRKMLSVGKWTGPLFIMGRWSKEKLNNVAFKNSSYLKCEIATMEKFESKQGLEKCYWGYDTISHRESGILQVKAEPAVDWRIELKISFDGWRRSHYVGDINSKKVCSWWNFQHHWRQPLGLGKM